MSESHHTSEGNNYSYKRTKRGWIFAWIKKYPWLIWLLPIVGLVSLIWFLIRVVPKPSRAMYPCQRLATPLASGFVVWIVGLISTTFVYRRTKCLLQKSRYMLAAICAAITVIIVWTSLSATNSNPISAAVFKPSEPVNSPMGDAKGIHPGRVVWIRDPDATSWNNSDGSWWDDDNTDQITVDSMVSEAIQQLTGETSDSKAC